MLELPVLLSGVHGHSPRTLEDNQQQSADNGHGLKKVIFHEIPVESIPGNGPEGVQPNVEDTQPRHEDQGTKLGLEPNGNQGHQDTSDHEFQHLEERDIEVHQGDKHKYQKDSSRQLHVRLRLVGIRHMGDSREQRMGLLLDLSQQQHQTTANSDVPEKQCKSLES